MIRNNERVTDVHAENIKTQEAGICLLDMLKLTLTVKAQKTTEEEVKGLACLCAFNYHKVAVGLAGILIPSQQNIMSKHLIPETYMDTLIYTAIHVRLVTADKSVFVEGG
jgi:hypothetical protein